MADSKPRASGGEPYVAEKEKIGTATRDVHGRFVGPDAAVEAEKVRRAAAKAGAPATDRSSTRRPAAAKPRAAQQAERAKQALLGSLLRESDGDGGEWRIDPGRLRDALSGMTPAEAQRLADLLAQVRKDGTAGSEADSGSPLLGRVEETLAARGIRLELRGQTNNIYVAGDNSTWNVRAAPAEDAAAPAAGATRGPPSRAAFRNSWGYHFGRTVKNFINGH